MVSLKGIVLSHDDFFSPHDEGNQILVWSSCVVVNYTWPLSVSFPQSLCLLSISISAPLTSSSPHPAVLPGFLLFLGRHVRPHHVGAAVHSGWLCAQVPGPRSLSRFVSLQQIARGGWGWTGAFSYCNWQHFSLGPFIIHTRTNEMLSQ